MMRYLRALGSVRGMMLLVLLAGLNLAAGRVVQVRYSPLKFVAASEAVPGDTEIESSGVGAVEFRNGGASRYWKWSDVNLPPYLHEELWPNPPLTAIQTWLPVIASAMLTLMIVAGLVIRSRRAAESQPSSPRNAGRARLAWVLVVGVGLVLGVWTSKQVLTRYDELNSGWSWDLAYYNQWFWALTCSDGILSVRPMAMYAVEGPSVWKMNYLAPMRFLIAPIYQLRPEPTTLLIVHAFLFWASIPAAFVLAKQESGSTLAGVLAALLVPLTPLLEPLAANDFRELQLALPFVILALAGVRGRRPWLACLGISGMLACRQEFAMMVATLAIVPAREPEDLGVTYRWARFLFLLGIGWTLLFLGYLRITSGPSAPLLYLQQFGGQKAPLHQTLATSAEFLLVGLGAWGALMWIQPRAGLLVFPWVWNLASGRWALRYLGTTEWHHVRYAAPLVAVGLAAGVLGWGNLWRRLSGRVALYRWGLLAATVVGLVAPWFVVHSRFVYAPRPIPLAEARALKPYLDNVTPYATVLADYAVTAPLSSRRKLYAYELDPNLPPGYPTLAQDVRQVFAKPWKVKPEILTSQGFAIIHKGPTIWVYTRDVNADRTPAMPREVR